MNTNKILCALFGVASCCFFAGTVNHIINESGGILSSLLLALGCLCMSVAFYRRK